MFVGFRIPWKLVAPALIALAVLFHEQIAYFWHILTTGDL